MSLVSFAFCFFFALNAFGPDTATQVAGQAPATQETKKSAEAPEGTPTQEGTQQQNEPKQTPSASEKPATTTEPREGAHAASPEKKGEEAREVAEESAQGPAEEKVVDKDHPQTGEPKPLQKTGAKEPLFSREEAHEAHRGGRKRSRGEITEEHKTPEGTLYSVKEAIEAGKKKKELLTGKSHATGKPPAAEQPEPEKKDVEKKPAEKPEKTVKKSRKARKKEGWQKIEMGFAYKDVQLLRGSYSFETHFVGEMRNNSSRNFGIVKFLFSTYNKRGKLITEEAFQITDFYIGQVQIFKGTIVDTYKDIASQRVIFLSAAPTAMD
ncbi:MAG: hypothetical protein V3V45_05085 [Candidatus Brocadiales bacterium]